jgi:cell division protein ZapA
MAEVALTINGRQYGVTCDDGQEPHLLALADLIEERVQDLVASVGQVGEARLLMMASLLIADELKAAQRAGPGSGNGHDPDQERAAAAIERCAERLEAIAAHLEGD